MQNFWHGFEKRANFLTHGAELAGLGILDVPGERDIADPHTSEKEKSKARWERTGLGVLALPSLYAAGKGTYEFGKKYGPKAVGFGKKYGPKAVGLAKKYGPKLFKR